MTRFTHLILTPFNLKIHGAPGLEPSWLHHRFELFERFCYPSVRGQSNQEFTWLVLLDPDTPASFKERVDTLRDYARFKPVYTAGLADYHGPALDCVAPGSTHLITTTLDNDDALASGFVERVQREFKGQAFELVNFVNGYRLQLQTDKVYRHRVVANPFISLIERCDAPVTIRGCGPHDLLRSKYDRIREVDAEPLWLQVVHDRNIAATGVWGCRRVSPAVLAESFTLAGWTPKRRGSAVSIAVENIRRRAERALIESLGEQRATRLRKTIRATRNAFGSTKRSH